jgi:site-specific DNA-adenine methylase
MKLDIASLRLLVLATADFSNQSTFELFKHEDVADKMITDNKPELIALIKNVKRMSILLISMVEALQDFDNSDEIMDDIRDTAETNLEYSKQILGVLSFCKR